MMGVKLNAGIASTPQLRREDWFSTRTTNTWPSDENTGEFARRVGAKPC